MVPTPPLGSIIGSKQSAFATGALQRTWLALGCGAANHKLRRGIAHQLRQHLVVALQTTNCVVASRINCDSAATCRVLQNEQIALQRITRTAPQTRPQRHAHTGASRPMWGRGGQGRPPGWTHTIGGGGEEISKRLILGLGCIIFPCCLSTSYRACSVLSSKFGLSSFSRLVLGTKLFTIFAFSISQAMATLFTFSKFSMRSATSPHSF